MWLTPKSLCDIAQPEWPPSGDCFSVGVPASLKPAFCQPGPGSWGLQPSSASTVSQLPLSPFFWVKRPLPREAGVWVGSAGVRRLLFVACLLLFYVVKWYCFLHIGCNTANVSLQPAHSPNQVHTHIHTHMHTRAHTRACTHTASHPPSQLVLSLLAGKLSWGIQAPTADWLNQKRQAQGCREAWALRMQTWPAKYSTLRAGRACFLAERRPETFLHPAHLSSRCCPLEVTPTYLSLYCHPPFQLVRNHIHTEKEKALEIN